MDIKSIVATAIKKYFTEVAQPKSPNEQRFVDQHTIEFWPHPVAFDSQFDGTIQKDTSRDADYQPGEDAAVYDQAYGEETVTTGFAHLQELSRDTLASYHNKSATQHAPLGIKKRNADKQTIARIRSGKTLSGYKPKDALTPEEDALRKKRLGGMRQAMKRLDKIDGIHESFTPGGMSFRDGTKVAVTEKEASILNKLYSSLDTIRQKDMKEHVGKSVKNYKAVLEFAIATKGK